jgi:methylmalonyl-CoA mutase C-terminal domain/subunit
MEEHPRIIRVLLCNPGLDGHDRGVKVVARALRDAGMEVIYLPLRTSVDEVVRVAVQEDVDVVGISNLSASLVSTCRQVRQGLARAGAEDVLIVAGGTLLDEDRALLRQEGITGVFGPGTATRDIVAFIRQNVPSERRGSLASEEAR